MGPIEILYLSIAAIITLIGVARGYVKELGTMLIVLVGIFILTFFQEQITSVATTIATDILGLSEGVNTNLFVSMVFSITFVAIVFAGYAGKTLTFPGEPAPNPQGFLLSVLVGMINGYLIAGTLWYYQDEFDYPIQAVMSFTPTLTPTAQALVEVLPQNIFPNPVYWIVPVAVLLLFMVRR